MLSAHTQHSSRGHIPSRVRWSKGGCVYGEKDRYQYILIFGDKYQYILIFYHFPSHVGGTGPDKRLHRACLKMIFDIVVC